MGSAVASKSHIVPVIMLAAAAILIVATVALGAWLGGDDTRRQAGWQRPLSRPRCCSALPAAGPTAGGFHSPPYRW